MMNLNSNTPQINFTSLRSQCIKGDLAIREFRKEMGYLKSSSNLAVRIMSLENKGKLYPGLDFRDAVRYKQNEWYSNIYNKEFFDIIAKKTSKNINEFGQQLEDNIRKIDNKADCGVQMILFFIKLLKQGEKPRIFQINYKYLHKGKMMEANHYSIVTGLKKGARLSNPKTWGNKAIIQDPYFGISKPVIEGLKDLDNGMSGGRTLISKTYKPCYVMQMPYQKN